MKRSMMLAAALYCVCSPLVAQSDVTQDDLIQGDETRSTSSQQEQAESSSGLWNLNTNREPIDLSPPEDPAPSPLSDVTSRESNGPFSPKERKVSQSRERNAEKIQGGPFQGMQVAPNQPAFISGNGDISSNDGTSKNAGASKNVGASKNTSTKSATSVGAHGRSLMAKPNYPHYSAQAVDNEFLAFGPSTYNPTLAYMQCDPYGQTVWNGFPCQRARELARQYQHSLGTCNCFCGCSHHLTGGCCQGMGCSGSGCQGCTASMPLNRYHPTPCGSSCDQHGQEGVYSQDPAQGAQGGFIQQSQLPQSHRRLADQPTPTNRQPAPPQITRQQSPQMLQPIQASPPVQAPPKQGSVATLWPAPQVAPQNPIPSLERNRALPDTARKNNSVDRR